MMMSETFRAGIVIDPHYSSHNPASRRDDFSAAMLEKTGFLAKQSRTLGWDAFVIAGDLFSTATLTYGYLVLLSRALKEFACPVYVVAGNHDMRHRQIDSIDKQPLGMLFEAEAVLDLTEVGPVGPFVGMHYRDNPAEFVPDPTPWHGHSWLICHQYVGVEPHGFEADAGGWLLYDDIDAHKYTGVVAGHDHVEVLDETTPGGAVVIRPGALSRGTKHEHNLHRTPRALSVEFSSDGSRSIKRVEIPVAADVFLQTALLAAERSSELKGFVTALGSDAFRQEEMDTSVMDHLRLLAESQEIAPEVVRRATGYLEAHGIV